MTWKEMKQFCESLNDEQLEKKVIMWREEEVINDISAFTLGLDHYIDKERGEDGCIEESTAKEIAMNNEIDYPNGMDHFEKVYDKGFPLLHENF